MRSAPVTNSSGNPIPIRPVRLGECRAAVEQCADGSLRVSNLAPLGDYPVRITDRLEHWSRTAPDRVWLAARDALGGWRRLRYGEARDTVRRIAAALRARGLSAERPVVILSGNSIDHALLGTAALHSGIPYAPVSPAYSLVSADFGRLRHIFGLLDPGLVFVEDAGPFARAIAAALPGGVELVVSHNAPEGRPATPFTQLLGSEAGSEVDGAHARIGPETIAKFLFTSGSTGVPKAVINTQRMICSNVAMIGAHFAYLNDAPPVVLDWSPWNHTAGGNHNFNFVLHHGGTLYIDDGRPLPGAIEATVRNLREVSPTWYFNVPKGYAALLPYLHADPALARNFFRDLGLLWYAGAGMSPDTWDALDQIAYRTCGERVLVLSGLGSTETAPFAMAAGHTMVGAGNVGIPARGVEMKLVPFEDKWEARYRGPNITPGYWRDPELTARAFDEDGFYCIGDALRFADSKDVNRGLIFDGRIAEDFKLSTGTWVALGPLRSAALDHFAPLLHDVVIAGPGRDALAVLAFPDRGACRAFVGGEGIAQDDVIVHPALRAEFKRRLDDFAARATGSSNRVTRLLLLAEGPSIDHGEMTDKGSINQRAVLSNRAALVDAVYAGSAAGLIVAV
ncbi:MAG: feruloyl-CoA synthase [Betaproteobacteria bacterium RIFCSPLOWO2_12_FULL_63_13]|nr:MAG: feruloyl-CoA synthase [Betaproteobacteria bacterium RIFCSPLOWO2_12_FULL_63_13]